MTLFFLLCAPLIAFAAHYSGFFASEGREAAFTAIKGGLAFILAFIFVPLIRDLIPSVPGSLLGVATAFLENVGYALFFALAYILFFSLREGGFDLCVRRLFFLGAGYFSLANLDTWVYVFASPDPYYSFILPLSRLALWLGSTFLLAKAIDSREAKDRVLWLLSLAGSLAVLSFAEYVYVVGQFLFALAFAGVLLLASVLALLVSRKGARSTRLA
jgi:hypothetical protein